MSKEQILVWAEQYHWPRLVEAVMSLYDAPERTVVLFDTTGQALRLIQERKE